MQKCSSLATTLLLFSAVSCHKQEPPPDPAMEAAIDRFQKLNAIFDYGNETGVEQLILKIDPDLTNDDLKHVNQFVNLEHLNLYNTSVDDKGLAHLKSIDNLIHLNLGKTRISDASVEKLKSYTTLMYLYVDDTNITRREHNNWRQRCRIAKSMTATTFPGSDQLTLLDLKRFVNHAHCLIYSW